MKRVLFVLAVMTWLTAAAMAQQNQVPGDTTAGGGSQTASTGAGGAVTTQSGANTSDGTTTGASGPKKAKSGPAGDLALPPLPSAALCKRYAGDVQSDCLSTVLNATAGAAP